jgi:hypothetical protein
MAFNFNTFHQDRFTISLSNLPTISNVGDLEMYSRMAKSVTFPDYNMTEMYSDIEGFRIRHQAAPLLNIDLSQLQIAFTLNEDWSNYLNLFDWMRKVKYGDVSLPNTEFFRKYTVKRINLQLLDNEKREIVVVGFSEAFLLGLSSINLEFGSSEEVVFTSTWSYEEITITRTSTGS